MDGIVVRNIKDVELRVLKTELEELKIFLVESIVSFVLSGQAITFTLLALLLQAPGVLKKTEGDTEYHDNVGREFESVLDQ
jgi:hypothetical protein